MSELFRSGDISKTTKRWIMTLVLLIASSFVATAYLFLSFFIAAFYPDMLGWYFVFHAAVIGCISIHIVSKIVFCLFSKSKNQTESQI
jgi:ABC-type multidrug transport system permease subunit